MIRCDGLLASAVSTLINKRLRLSGTGNDRISTSHGMDVLATVTSISCPRWTCGCKWNSGRLSHQYRSNDVSECQALSSWSNSSSRWPPHSSFLEQQQTCPCHLEILIKSSQTPPLFFSLYAFWLPHSISPFLELALILQALR